MLLVNLNGTLLQLPDKAFVRRRIFSVPGCTVKNIPEILIIILQKGFYCRTEIIRGIIVSMMCPGAIEILHFLLGFPVSAYGI